MSVCLVCSVTPGFVPGAIVMIYSFLNHNAWFNGDLLIFHKDLSAEDQRKLLALNSNVDVRMISSEMIDTVDKVTAVRPELRTRQSSFYKGELLKLTQYDRIIMSDCDIIYTGSIEPVVVKNLELQACGDGSFYRGERRKRYDYSLVRADEDPALKSTFSAGFAVFSSSLFSPDHFDRYISMMNDYCESRFPTNNTDQAIFNVLFDGKLSRLDCIYNYHLMHKELIKEKTGKKFSEAIVLHYGGQHKPWNLAHWAEIASTDDELYETFLIWRAAYSSYLNDASTQKNVGSVSQ